MTRSLASLRKQALSMAFAKIDRMTAEELLEFVDRKEFPSTYQNPDNVVMVAKQYAFRRLERITA